ncbi:MAG: hypothetical protein QXL01_00340 [Thermoplasmatales archaeon]
MEHYTKKELEELPMTQEEADAVAAVVRGSLLNHIQFWILMGGLVAMVYFILSIPDAIHTTVFNYFGISK